MNKRLSYPIYALLCGFLLAGAAHAGTISVDLWELDSYCDSGGSCTTLAPSSWIATIGTIDDSTLPLGYSVVTLSPTGITLFGNSEYWIGLSTTDSYAGWGYEADDSGTGVQQQVYYNNNEGITDNSNGAYLMTVADDLQTEFDSIGSGPLPAIGYDSIIIDAPFASFATGGFTGLNSNNMADLTSVSLALDMEAPEPGCAWLLGAGLVGLLAWRVRSRIAGRALAAVLALAAGLALSLPARAQESLRPAIHHPDADEVEATRAYWTKERMASAIPVPPVVAEPPSRRGRESPISTRLRAPEPDITVIPGFDLAAAPKGATPGTDPGLPTIPPPTGTCTSCAGDYTCPLVNSTFAVPPEYYNTTPPQPNLPYSAIGKLFFVGYDGGNYECSGSSIGGSAVLTAGHCVSDGKGHFNKNFVFAPGVYGDPFNGGTSPSPYLWVATHVMTFQDYLVNGESAMGHMGRDVGFAIMQGYQNGVPVSTTLSDSVGHLGFAWNQNPTGLTWNAFGYPATSPGGMFNGWEMGQTNAITGCRVNYENPAWVGIGSGMGGGASGGPWILGFWPTLSTLTANYVGGISVWSNNLTQIYSPYFDASVKQLKDVAVATKP